MSPFEKALGHANCSATVWKPLEYLLKRQPPELGSSSRMSLTFSVGTASLRKSQEGQQHQSFHTSLESAKAKVCGTPRAGAE